MAFFLEVLAAGVATGCAFALVATGFVAIYRVTRVVNFAQGVFAVVGGFTTWTLLRHGLPHGISEALAVLVAAAVGLLIGLIAIGKPGTPPLASLIITLGLGIASYAVIVLVWGDQPVSYQMLSGVVTVFGVSMQTQFLLITVVTLATFAGLLLFFLRTYVGKALTACSSNPHAARLMGINVTRMGLLAFTLGGALGGLAGVLVAPIQSISFNSDVPIAINGFAAAIFGGILRPGAALLGGLVLGVSEALVAGYYKANFQFAAALVLMLGIMVWQGIRRPEGVE